MENKIFIYNSLTRKKEEFIPIKPKEVKMYVCGPTVYDQPHIGHARSAYIFDVIRRYLTYRGYKVKFVRNVTDVDDKIINKAQSELAGKDLNSAVKEVSAKYLDLYHEDMKSLGIQEPDAEPKATEYVCSDKPLMQQFIQQLIDKGCAYVAEGDVYFDIKKAKGYGKLSNQDLEKMESGARISLGEKKKDPLDFALWKAAKPGEPAWESPWGRGRPGWHIECSVMSSDILGDEFDIHGGGIDLIFPHHENEIAQSEGLGKKFARYWMHHGLLTINGQKMSKSLGNFVTVKDFLAKHKNADFLKLLFLSTHYLHPVDYTDGKIEEAKKQIVNLQVLFLVAGLRRKIQEEIRKNIFSSKEKEKVDKLCDQFNEAMDNDFHTPQALSCILELADYGLALGSMDKEEGLMYVESKLRLLLRLFGIEINPILKEESLVLKECSEWVELRKNKKYAEADKKREEIDKILKNQEFDCSDFYDLVVCTTASSISLSAAKRK